MRTTDLTDSQKLNAARTLILEVANDLNDGHSKCDSCGLTHYEDFDAFQKKKSLMAIAQKLHAMQNSRGMKSA